MPADLVQAFHDAIGVLGEWQSGEPEPRLLLRNRAYTIGEIANWVSVFNDPMPADIYDGLCQLGGEADPPRGANFVAGGPFLRRLYVAMNRRLSVDSTISPNRRLRSTYKGRFRCREFDRPAAWRCQ